MFRISSVTRALRLPVLALAVPATTAAGCNSLTETNSNGGDADDPVAGRVVVGEVADAGSWGADAYDFGTASIAGDTLTIEVSYGGGCRDHVFTLVVAPAFMESDPVRVAAALAHEGNDDPCQAWLTQSYTFELDPIKTRYRNAYDAGSGTVVIDLRDYGGDALRYEFGG